MDERKPMALHYTELLAAEPGSPLAVEWELYRREVGRLIAEGHEGKHVLIKGEEIIGLYDTHREAADEGYDRYLFSGFLVHQIQTWEPIIRSSSWYFSCPTSR
jgi:hypothetical protein